jgi:xanthine dehydrogenase accessory factor
VSLSPPEELGRRTAGEVIEVPLTCVSGGALEIYLEPYLPRPQLVLIGHLAVTRALASLGHELGFSVSVVSPEEALGSLPGAPPVLKGLALDQLNLGPRSYVVVASHGNYDEEGVEAALRTSAGYVALVASRKRAESIREYLRETDVAPERAAELRCPAGLDIGAATPEEIALSILAEIVQFRRRSQTAPALGEAPRAPRAEEAVDPVCGMSVQVGTARHKTEHEGRVYYFCAASCQRAFEKDPQARLAAFRDGESQ